MSPIRPQNGRRPEGTYFVIIENLGANFEVKAIDFPGEKSLLILASDTVAVP